MARVLVTGFGPFDRFQANPSEELARHLAREGRASFKVLPVVYGKAREELLQILDEERPRLIISFGLNAGIGFIAVEEIAINIRSSEVPDTSGLKVEDKPVLEGGPLAYRTRLPTVAIRKALRENGIPARSSHSAGVYLCNEVFYTLMEWCERTSASGGFVHIPMATEMIAQTPERYSDHSMSMEMIRRAGEIIMETSISGLR